MLTKKWAGAAVAMALVLGLASCGGQDDNSGESGNPITIGVLGPISGAFADAGLNYRQGAQIAADQINARGGVLGRQLKVEAKDTAAGPQEASQAVRDFVSSGTNFLIGELSSANCLADAPLVDQLDAVFITGICSVEELTGQAGQAAPYSRTFRAGATSSANIVAMADAIGRRFPQVTTYDSFAFDYVTGHLQWDQYVQAYADNGKPITVGKDLWVPMDQQNYGSQISVLATASTEGEHKGLYIGTYGAGTASFLQQAEPYDFLKNYEVVVTPGGYYPVARDLNGSAPLVWNGYEYNWAAYDTPENDAFVADFEALAGKKPITWSYVSYVAVLAYAAAIEKAGSDSPADVAAALAGIAFASPQGEYLIDAVTHNGSANIVLMETEGDPNDPERVRMLETIVIPYTDTVTFNF
ncbi:MAG: ABC transporter substrate-binding protein [Propionibacteriaceae bacterium]|nr:ABC transporter substrate-binding protein [Propionibacteriaceae bacterium]